MDSILFRLKQIRSIDDELERSLAYVTDRMISPENYTVMRYNYGRVRDALIAAIVEDLMPGGDKISAVAMGSVTDLMSIPEANRARRVFEVREMLSSPVVLAEPLYERLNTYKEFRSAMRPMPELYLMPFNKLVPPAAYSLSEAEVEKAIAGITASRKAAIEESKKLTSAVYGWLAATSPSFFDPFDPFDDKAALSNLAQEKRVSAVSAEWDHHKHTEAENIWHERNGVVVCECDNIDCFETIEGITRDVYVPLSEKWNRFTSQKCGYGILNAAVLQRGNGWLLWTPAVLE